MIAVALGCVALVAMWERRHLWAFARERPFRLGAHPLADGGAFDLSLVEVVHHLRPFPLDVRPFVLVDAVALRHTFADTSTPRLELLANRLLVGLVPPALLALEFQIGAVVAFNEHHAGGAS